MTGEPDEGHRTVDVRGAQGVQINPSGGNTQNIYNAAPPSLDDDLRTLDGVNPLMAYKLFSGRPPDRQLALLAAYAGATELIEAIFINQGAGSCADLLSALRVDRAVHLLDSLASDQQNKIMADMARELADKDSLDDAKARVKQWADVRPEHAARLLAEVAALDPAGGTHVGPRGAIHLLPGGPCFLLGLPSRLSAQLLLRLLPQSSPGTAGQHLASAQAADVDALLGQMVEFDPQHTATVMVVLGPKQAAAYLPQLRLKAGARLLMHMADAAPDTRDDFWRALPGPILGGLLVQIATDFPGSEVVPDRHPWTVGWPWIDVTSMLLMYAAPAATRLIRSGDGFAVSVKREAENARDVWRAARRTIRDSHYYRRQRNHLAVVTFVLAVALLATWTFA
jgi:hypothetical protein